MFMVASDEDLVARAREGHAKSWDKLIRRHEKNVYNYTLRMTGNPEDALDLMQDIFFSVFKSLDRFRGDAQFKTWLYRLMSNRCVDYFRSKKAEQGQEDPEHLEQLQDAGPSPLQTLARNDDNRAIAALLSRLNEEQRVIIELKIFQDLSFDEIAEILQISANTIKTRFYAAIKRMKREMEISHGL